MFSIEPYYYITIPEYAYELDRLDIMPYMTIGMETNDIERLNAITRCHAR
jgi:hypothetical protein